MWENIVEYLFKPESVAVFVGLLVFLVAMLLFVRKLINFLMTVFLLIFSIAAGLAIVNYDVVREAAVNKNSDERKIFEEKWESFKDRIEELFQKMTDNRESQTSLMENIIEIQSHFNTVEFLLRDEVRRNQDFRDQVTHFFIPASQDKEVIK